MTLGEATRQYQAALEWRRSVVFAFGDNSSFHDELAAADVEVATHRRVLECAWLEGAAR